MKFNSTKGTGRHVEGNGKALEGELGAHCRGWGELDATAQLQR